MLNNRQELVKIGGVEMSPKEIDDLMGKRGFSLACRRGDGIRVYTYSDIEKQPRFIVMAIPGRDEFKFRYVHNNSINYIETPWCSPIGSKEHFRKILIQFKKWIRKIEELYEEE